MSTPSFNPPDAPPWDDDLAANLPGKTVLIGVTVFDHTGKVLSRHQMHGAVASACKQRGIVIALAGVHEGRTYGLPPDTSGFHPAGPGEYHLKTTGETVIDPDYTVVWECRKAPPSAST